MLERTVEYHGMIYRIHKLPIRHVVIFLGKGKATMKTELPEKEVFRGFDLINLHELDAKKLLSSQVPEVILLALLADFGEEQKEVVLRLLVRNLKIYSKSNNDLEKYLNQLQLLSKLRNLEEIADEIIKDMSINYDGKSHILYQRGLSAGLKKSEQLIEQEREKYTQTLEDERKKSEQLVNNERKKSEQLVEETRLNQIMGIKQLLELGNLNVGQIASIMSVDIQFVEQIKSGEIS